MSTIAISTAAARVAARAPSLAAGRLAPWSAALDRFGDSLYKAARRGNARECGHSFAGCDPFDLSTFTLVQPLAVALRRVSRPFGGPLLKDLRDARIALQPGRTQKLEAVVGFIIGDLEDIPAEVLSTGANVLLQSDATYVSLFSRFPDGLMESIRTLVLSVEPPEWGRRAIRLPAATPPAQSAPRTRPPIARPPRILWNEFWKALALEDEIALREIIRLLIQNRKTPSRNVVTLLTHSTDFVRDVAFEVFCRVYSMDPAQLLAALAPAKKDVS